MAEAMAYYTAFAAARVRPAPGSWLLPPPWLPAPGSGFPVPGSWLPAPGSRLPVPGSRLLALRAGAGVGYRGGERRMLCIVPG